MKDFLLLIVLWVLIGIFAIIVSPMVIPAFRKYVNFCLVIVSGISFSLLGLILIFLTLRGKIKGKLKKSLFLIGISAIGFFVSILLHNLFYGLSIITSQTTWLSYLAKGLEGGFFILGVFICPFGFLGGIITSFLLFIKRKKKGEGIFLE